jgi:cohesin complex subunit SA-1/2
VTRSNPEEEMDESTGDEEPITPKAKPRPRPLQRQKTPSETGAAEEDLAHDPSMDLASPSMMQEVDVEQFATSTPQSSRKRPRSDEHEEEMSEGPSGRESVPGSPEGPEIEVRRKRVRH